MPERPLGRWQHYLLGGVVTLFGLLSILGTGAGTASAAGPPVIVESWASGVFSGTARLNARINPNGASSGYHVDFIPKSSYDANVGGGKDPFSGAARVPLSSDALIAGAGTLPVQASQQASALSPGTTYRYRFVAKNSFGTSTGATLTFATQALGGAVLPDNRGWEMVSPVDKNGGEVAAPGALAGGGVLQAAADGQSFTYGSVASFAGGGVGAATASQYLATRAAGGWATENITAPLYSSSYNTDSEGVPYQLFSGDLTRALLLNGRHCRGEGTGCAVPNPPLAGTDAPAGYQNFYLRENAGGAFTALLGSANAGFLALEPRDFELRLAGSSADLRHAVLSTCAALTADAVEVPLGEGCDPAKPNLYRYSPGAGLTLLNLEPGDTQGTAGAELAAQTGAVSADGTRAYFTLDGALYLREGATTKEVDAIAGGGGAFQTTSVDGAIAYFTKAGHLWRFLAEGTGSATDITPAGEVLGVLGTSESGSRVYYRTPGGLFAWSSGATVKVAEAADASNYPPATGTARVSADGTKLLFVATAPLTGYDNVDLNTGLLDSQVYLYDAIGAGTLTCVSCNPTSARPSGPSTVPGATANGTAPGSLQAYKPRALTADGRRAFFESTDAIGLADTNGNDDVYQWEAQGVGSCHRSGGCVALISSGRAAGGASFIDASADGADAFFLTDGSLVTSDPGSVDLYDARIDGGFPAPVQPIACTGDSCQPLPSRPVDPTLTTLLSGPGNPQARYSRTSRRCKQGKVRRKGFCVKKKGKGKRGPGGQGRAGR